jgi:hypothetical protein
LPSIRVTRSAAVPTAGLKLKASPPFAVSRTSLRPLAAPPERSAELGMPLAVVESKRIPVLSWAISFSVSRSDVSL